MLDGREWQERPSIAQLDGSETSATPDTVARQATFWDVS
jgi:hypothetical protein